MMEARHGDEAGSSTEDVVRCLSSFSSAKGLCFRGQADVAWPVRSRLGRLLFDAGVGSETDGNHQWVQLASEDAIFANFMVRHRACDLVPERTRGLHDQMTPNGLALAQHHGCPTRLVDWTTSPWVAAAFACNERPQADGAIFWFDIHAVETAASAELKRCGLEEGAGGMIDLGAAFQADTPPFVTTVHDQEGFERIRQQQGLFTFSSKITADHVAYLARLMHEPSATSGTNMGRVVIPSSAKAEVRAAAERNGVSRFDFSSPLDAIGGVTIGEAENWVRRLADSTDPPSTLLQLLPAALDYTDKFSMLARIRRLAGEPSGEASGSSASQ